MEILNIAWKQYDLSWEARALFHKNDNTLMEYFYSIVSELSFAILPVAKFVSYCFSKT